MVQNRLFPVGWPRRPMEGLAVGGVTHNFVSRLDSMELGGIVILHPVAGWSERIAAGLDSLRRHFRQPGRTDTLVIARGTVERTVMLRQRELP